MHVVVCVAVCCDGWETPATSSSCSCSSSSSWYTTATGEAVLGAVGFLHVSVSEHPIASLGLRWGPVSHGLREGLWGVSCEGAQEQQPRD